MVDEPCFVPTPESNNVLFSRNFTNCEKNSWFWDKFLLTTHAYTTKMWCLWTMDEAYHWYTISKWISSTLNCLSWTLLSTVDVHWHGCIIPYRQISTQTFSFDAIAIELISMSWHFKLLDEKYWLFQSNGKCERLKGFRLKKIEKSIYDTHDSYSSQKLRS